MKLTPELQKQIDERNALLARLAKTVNEIKQGIVETKAADKAAIEQQQKRNHTKGRNNERTKT